MSIKIKNSNQEAELNKLTIQSERIRITDEMVSKIRQKMGGPLQIPGNNELSSKLQELIKTAGNHPEVGEIDHNDLIIGVRFEGADYPPTVDDDDDEDS